MWVSVKGSLAESVNTACPECVHVWVCFRVRERQTRDRMCPCLYRPSLIASGNEVWWINIDHHRQKKHTLYQTGLTMATILFNLCLGIFPWKKTCFWFCFFDLITLTPGFHTLYNYSLLCWPLSSSCEQLELRALFRVTMRKRQVLLFHFSYPALYQGC